MKPSTDTEAYMTTLPTGRSSALGALRLAFRGLSLAKGVNRPGNARPDADPRADAAPDGRRQGSLHDALHEAGGLSASTEGQRGKIAGWAAWAITAAAVSGGL
jgi:hypothetical protein